MIGYSIINTRSATDPGAPISRGFAVSGTPTVYSDMFAEGGLGSSIIVQTTRTLAGTWTLWATNKIHPTLADDTDWLNVTSNAEFTETNPAGAATHWQASLTLLHAGHLRLKYVNSSGAGTIYADVSPA